MRMMWAALVAAGLSTAAVAQEDDVLMLYGRVFLTAASAEATGGARPLENRTVVGDQASHLGVRAIESLGGDLKGFFQLETSFRTDISAGPVIGDRNSAVGLQGNWGTFLMGRWDSPFKVVTLVIDPYGDLTPSGITGVLDDLGNFDRRLVNVVQYWSPNIGGLVFRYAHKPAEPPLDLDQRVNSASVRFSRRLLYAFAAWETHESSAVHEKGVALGATYSIGAWKLGGQFQKFDKSNRTDARAWMANAIYTVGKTQLIGQYMRSKGGGAYGVLQPECDSWSVAYQYNISRRTFLVASYVRVDNNQAGMCNFGGNNALGIQPGQDPRSFWAGIGHLF